ncbi:MAG: undecaprenyl/decaprenyl-phosphate alpha-N-acetylglucosaminyl 1-phosphate transferase [Phycisphaeraceae bacterium]|nr:undecaprenyl/decaprenyl-phosphate alpha-N-acetylglucosaminyl 1-phosphate transferase [Phycisphaeraceae bacterium]
MTAQDVQNGPFAGFGGTGIESGGGGLSVLRDLPGDVAQVPIAGLAGAENGSFTISIIELLNQYTPIFLAAFLVTLLTTPLIRRIAISAGVIDRPDAARKSHPLPVAYLGGVSVFLGILAALVVAVFFSDSETTRRVIPIGVIIGMFAITFTGLADDVWGWDPRLKLVGQLIAAAALALNEELGGQVARGLLAPFLPPADTDPVFSVLGLQIVAGDVYKWIGTGLIALFVLGGCNAANLIDGLDGLLSGVTAIMAVALLAICLVMTMHVSESGTESAGSGPLAMARIVLCVALLGAVLGFLPHNFNPATIFLGDCGSLLLGFMCVVIILMLGDRGRTDLVLAGLIVFGLPIMDTTLAIIRRKLAGQPMSAGDDQHIHHQLRRVTGSVRKAVFCLYGITVLFAGVGVSLAWLVLVAQVRVRFLYAIAIVIFAFIGVIAVKAARRRQLEVAMMNRFGDAAMPVPPVSTRQPTSTTSR